jgi:hypothetical protein
MDHRFIDHSSSESPRQSGRLGPHPRRVGMVRSHGRIGLAFDPALVRRSAGVMSVARTVNVDKVHASPCRCRAEGRLESRAHLAEEGGVGGLQGHVRRQSWGMEVLSAQEDSPSGREEARQAAPQPHYSSPSATRPARPPGVAAHAHPIRQRISPTASLCSLPRTGTSSPRWTEVP